MKTQIIKKHIKISTYIFTVVLLNIFLTGSTQNSSMLLDTITDNSLLAMNNIPKYDINNAGANANSYYFEITERDESLEIENWMINEHLSISSETLKWQSVDNEQELEIENWMVMPNLSTDKETPLKIENWMSETWNK